MGGAQYSRIALIHPTQVFVQPSKYILDEFTPSLSNIVRSVKLDVPLVIHL